MPRKEYKWQRNLKPGDEVWVDIGQPDQGTSIIIKTIDYQGDECVIVADDGEIVRCIVRELRR